MTSSAAPKDGLNAERGARTAALGELVPVLVVTGLGYVLAARVNLFEVFASWSRRHETYNVDEIAAAAVFGCAALGVYAWRRYRCAAAEMHRLVMTERALADTTEQYRSLFDCNPNAVFSVDLAGVFVASNAAASKVSGYSAPELGDLDVRALVPHSHARAANEVFARASNREPQQVEAALMHKDGHLVELSVTGVPIVVSGEVVGVHCIAEDISERKQMQRELMETQRAAEHANEAKSVFLTNVSHEIRTPLTSLLGTAEILMDTDLDPLQTKFVDTMNRSGGRLLTLVTDILDFSRMEAGTARAEVRDVDVRAVVREVGARARPSAEHQGLGLTVDMDPGLPGVLKGDQVRVAQVLTQLLDNAVKFTEDGWVRVCVSGAKVPQGGWAVRFLVEDSGIGMTEEHQGRLFDAFSQADASMTRKYGGTGIGLALCKQSVTLIGGSIWANSTVELGSAFTVVVPMGCPPEAEEAGRPASASFSGAR